MLVLVLPPSLSPFPAGHVYDALGRLEVRELLAAVGNDATFG